MSVREPQWRQIPGASRYDVSDQGQVRSWASRYDVSGRAAAPHPLRARLSGRYPSVEIRFDDGSERSRHIHVLVLAAFRGPRPPGMVSRHANGIKTDNRLSNLNYCTPSQNARDKRRHGTEPHLKQTHCPSGHPYDQDNTYLTPRGTRLCRKCQYEHGRKTARNRSLALSAVRAIVAVIAAERRPMIEVERIRQLIPPELRSDDDAISRKIPIQAGRGTATREALSR